jgi:hydroxypyruvate isomerase
MKPIRQSAAWWCFVPGKLSAEQFVRAAAETGYEALDLVDRQYWQLVRDHGLQIAAVNGHRSLTAGFNRREHHAQLVQEVHVSLQLAEQWAIPNLICFSGNRDGLDDELGAQVTAEGLSQVAQAAEDAGVTLVLELLNSKVDHPGYQCDHTAWGVKVCQLVDSPRVRLLYDIYHMQVMEGDIIRTIQAYHPYFAHYHTAGNPGRNEIDATQELNYPAILGAIAATDYTGYVCHEFVPRGEPAAALKQAFDTGAVPGER